MRRSETSLVVLALILLASLLLISFLTPLERRVTAQSTENHGALTAEELRIVDKEGNVRIRLSSNENLFTIEILDENGLVVWKAPPNDELAGDTSSALEPYTRTGGSHWVQTVLDQGRIIILEDGSRWEVESLDQNETVLWAPTSPITVDEANTPVDDFRYTLTNTEENRSVRAKYRGR